MSKTPILLYTKFFKNQAPYLHFFNFFLFIFASLKNEKVISVNLFKYK